MRPLLFPKMDSTSTGMGYLHAGIPTVSLCRASFRRKSHLKFQNPYCLFYQRAPLSATHNEIYDQLRPCTEELFSLS